MSQPGRSQRSAHQRFEATPLEAVRRPAVSALPPGRPSSTGHMRWQIATLYVPGADTPLVQVFVKALIHTYYTNVLRMSPGINGRLPAHSPFLFRHDLRSAPSSKPPGLLSSTKSLPAYLVGCSAARTRSMACRFFSITSGA